VAADVAPPEPPDAPPPAALLDALAVASPPPLLAVGVELAAPEPPTALGDGPGVPEEVQAAENAMTPASRQSVPSPRRRAAWWNLFMTAPLSLPQNWKPSSPKDVRRGRWLDAEHIACLSI
jgi:hypothetical protein